MAKHKRKPRCARIYFTESEVYAEYAFGRGFRRIVSPIAQYKQVLDKLKADNVVLLYIEGDAFPKQDTMIAQEFILIFVRTSLEEALILRMTELIDNDERSLDEKCKAKDMLETMIEKENQQ